MYSAEITFILNMKITSKEFHSLYPEICKTKKKQRLNNLLKKNLTSCVTCAQHLPHMAVCTHIHDCCYFSQVAMNWEELHWEWKKPTAQKSMRQSESFMPSETWETCVFFINDDRASLWRWTLRGCLVTWKCVCVCIQSLTCRHVTQFRLNASMTRAKVSEAILRPSHRDSTKGMLPTCQSEGMQSSKRSLQWSDRWVFLLLSFTCQS